MKPKSPRLAQLCVLLLCTSMVAAQTPPRSTARITPNWSNADITVVAEAVGAATGITFVLDPRVRAQVTLTNTRAMTPQELYSVFLNILAVYNFAAIRSGNVVKIVPESTARSLPSNDLPSNLNNLAGDEIATAVIDLKNSNAVQISQVVRQLLGTAGVLNPTGNSIVITDRASNVLRIQKLLARLDQASTTGMETIPLQNAVASEVARTLSQVTQVQPAEAAAGTQVRIFADDRTNSLIVSGDPQQRLRIAALVETLDAPTATGGGTKVFTLKYATAEDLAATLNAQIKATTSATTGGAGAAPAASVAAVQDRSATILADKATNSLIITAPPRSMLSLTTIIEALDIAPLQVHIEAIVAEVKDTKAAALGVNWAVFSKEDGAKVPIGGFTSRVAGASIIDLVTGISTGDLTGLPEGSTVGVGKLNENGINLGVVLRALQKDVDSNVISYPNVTATNNVEAEMKAGSTVPFLTGQFTNTGGNNNGSVNPFNTVQREDVGTTLKVTPQIIRDNDEVILKIDLVNSALTNQSGDAGSQITTNNSVKTQVRVRSGSTIVIGGMIKDSADTTTARVPYLSRIPLLGYLFKDRGKNREKSSLMVFIQPKIVADGVQANAISANRWNQLQEMQNLQNNHRELLPLLPFETAPELPAIVGPESGVTPTAPAKATPAPAKP